MNKATTQARELYAFVAARHRFQHPTLPGVTFDWFHGGGFVRSDLIVRVDKRLFAIVEAFEA